MSLHLLIASVPWRRPSFRRLLTALADQTLKPDLVHVVLDGYGEDAAPPCIFPTREWRTSTPVGPGGRWRIAREVPPDTMLVVFDDDLVLALAPHATATLVEAADGAAASSIGVTLSGRSGNIPTGEDLICGSPCAGMVVRAGDLEGLQGLADDVRAKCGFDALGDCGDDEALVSALLWLRGVPIHHGCVPEIHSAQDCIESQTKKRLAQGGVFWHQRREIARVTGWPWTL